MVFDDDIAASHFLRLALDAMRWANVDVPLWVTYTGKLQENGPLSEAWRSPDKWHYNHPFSRK